MNLDDILNNSYFAKSDIIELLRLNEHEQIEKLKQKKLLNC